MYETLRGILATPISEVANPHLDQAELDSLEEDRAYLRAGIYPREPVDSYRPHPYRRYDQFKPPYNR